MIDRTQLLSDLQGLVRKLENDLQDRKLQRRLQPQKRYSQAKKADCTLPIYEQ
jgi:hypothetical protein